MNYPADEIDRFLAHGKSKEDFFLNWDGCDSFFDPEVQKILTHQRPANYETADIARKAFPVEAWLRADAVAASPNPENWKDLFDLWQQMPLWTAELLHALMTFRCEWARRHQKPESALDYLIAWRAQRFLYETTPLRHTHADAVRANTLAKKPIEWNVPGEPTPPSPVPVIETPDAPRKWMDGAKRTRSPEAYRQAAHNENKRRLDIMREWAESWLAFDEQNPPRLWAATSGPKKPLRKAFDSRRRFSS